jgi:hypothetical protein
VYPLTLLKALTDLVPVTVLCIRSAITFAKERTVPSAIQVLGAGFLVLVIFAHMSRHSVCLKWMRWGGPHNTGHYLDLASLVLGLTLFPLRYLLVARHERP